MLYGGLAGGGGDGGGERGMMHTVEPALAQYTPAEVMTPPQQEELPPGLPPQPDPPQEPHSEAQQTEPDATPVLQ